MQNNQTFIIEGLDGKKTLKGEVIISGSKNFALPAMTTTLLFKNPLILKNVPQIEDVFRMGEIIKKLGVKISKNKNQFVLQVNGKLKPDIDSDIAKKLRASIVLLGPLLGRIGKIRIPHPGGCAIGPRPINFFVENFKKMGATVKEENDQYIFETKNILKNTRIIFRQQSVTGTTTFMLAGILAKGEMVLENCALEPEIVELAKYLKENGADISGIGTNRMRIIGREGKLLESKKPLVIIPDRIEAGSFAIIGALAGKEILIKNCEPDHLTVFLETLREAGAKFIVDKNKIKILETKKTKSVNITTHEYPGFPTDLQSPFTILLTKTKGESTIFETIFENRLNYTEDLVRVFKAQIQMFDTNHITIKGVTSLKGGKVESPDLRAGLAFVIAGIVAKGKSEISNTYLIDRGYENIEKKLQKIGVKIKRVTKTV